MCSVSFRFWKPDLPLVLRCVVVVGGGPAHACSVVLVGGYYKDTVAAAACGPYICNEERKHLLALCVYLSHKVAGGLYMHTVLRSRFTVRNSSL